MEESNPREATKIKMEKDNTREVTKTKVMEANSREVNKTKVKESNTRQRIHIIMYPDLRIMLMLTLMMLGWPADRMSLVWPEVSQEDTSAGITNRVRKEERGYKYIQENTEKKMKMRKGRETPFSPGEGAVDRQEGKKSQKKEPERGKQVKARKEEKIQGFQFPICPQ